MPKALNILDCTDCKSLDEVSQKIDSQTDAAWEYKTMPDRLLVNKFVGFQVKARTRSVTQLSIFDKEMHFCSVPVEVIE